MKSPDNNLNNNNEQNEELKQENAKIETTNNSIGLSNEEVAEEKTAMNLDFDSEISSIDSEADKLTNESQQELNSETPSKTVERPPIPPLPEKKKGAEREPLPKAIERQQNESQAAYLARAGEEVRNVVLQEKGILNKDWKMNEQTLSSQTRDLILKIIEEARREVSTVIDKEANTKTIELIKKLATGHEHFAKPRDEETYDKTERSRKMFEAGNQKRGETYWNTLFFPYNIEAARAFAKEVLDGKTIVLLGGGMARLKEEMEQNGINPKEVLNIDPFVSEPETGADTVVPASATDERLPDILRERGVEQADEIWAEYSVPAYLDNPDDIKRLFKNIDTLLAENGSARIWPVQVRGGDEEEIGIRVEALKEALDDLNATGQYEVIEFKGAGRSGFTLHKVSKVI